MRLLAGPSSFKVDVLPSVPVKAAVIPPLSNIRHKVQPLPQIPLAEMLQPYNRVSWCKVPVLLHTQCPLVHKLSDWAMV
jgi:hypothetical protein